ncbi:MAG: hypothetical protein AAFY54_01945 [Cyanobacteria bacterium J06648_10]
MVKDAEQDVQLQQPEEKLPVLSSTMLGGVLLSGLDIADILTGDPWSLNGAIKWAGLILGAALVFVGRWRASKRLSWSPFFDWVRRTEKEFWEYVNGPPER